MTPPSPATLGERTQFQARALCQAAGLSARAADADALLQEMCASWSQRDPAQRPRWSSLTDDCSPIEYSVVLAPRPVRTFLGTGAGDPGPGGLGAVRVGYVGRPR